jgi:hypothetical protein
MRFARRIILPILISTAGGTVLVAKAPTETLPVGSGGSNSSPPCIQFAAPIYDFGRATSGCIIRHDFTFTNTGNGLLEISNVQTSCGCTEAGSWSRHVEPGETGTIPIIFDTANYDRLVAKIVRVTSNDPAHPVILLQFMGIVWRPINVIPPLAVFDVSADTSSNVTRVVRIVNNLASSITISTPESSTAAFAAELKTIRPGKEFQLVIKALPPFSIEKSRGVISLRTSSTNDTVITVPVFATIRHQREALPSANQTNRSVTNNN